MQDVVSAPPCVSLHRPQSPAAQQEAEKYIALIQRQTYHGLKVGTSILGAVLQAQQGRLSQVALAKEQFRHYSLSTLGFAALIEVYGLYWLDVEALEQWLPNKLYIHTRH